MDKVSNLKEKELCVILGLSRVQMKEMRLKYEEGVDWIKIPSKRPQNLWEVQWTETGIEKLRDVIGVQTNEVIEPPAQYKGTVLARFRNPRFIQIDMDGNKHTVICRDNNKFRAGMPVWVRWDGARWVVARHPRFDGKY